MNRYYDSSSGILYKSKEKHPVSLLVSKPYFFLVVNYSIKDWFFNIIIICFVCDIAQLSVGEHILHLPVFFLLNT